MLRSCTAEGHAGFAEKGHDIVCAALSCLLRTVLAQLEKSKTLVVKMQIQDRGMLAFSVEEFDKNDEFLLKYASDFLKTGISQLVEEFPEHISLRVDK
jgi:uncharacterized protein YsxB (DUF464 family)